MVLPLKSQRTETKSDLYGVLHKTTATNNNINDTYNKTHRIKILTTPLAIAFERTLAIFSGFLCVPFPNTHTHTQETAHYEPHIIAIILAFYLFFCCFRLFGEIGGNA